MAFEYETQRKDSLADQYASDLKSEATGEQSRALAEGNEDLMGTCDLFR